MTPKARNKITSNKKTTDKTSKNKLTKNPQKNKETTVCYAECIQMIILSVDRVSLIFFGFSRFF